MTIVASVTHPSESSLTLLAADSRMSAYPLPPTEQVVIQRVGFTPNS